MRRSTRHDVPGHWWSGVYSLPVPSPAQRRLGCYGIPVTVVLKTRDVLWHPVALSASALIVGVCGWPVTCWHKQFYYFIRQMTLTLTQY